MVVTSGRVVDGKVVTEGVPLPEGELVTIIARDSTDVLELTPAQEEFLLESAEQARRGQIISGAEMLRRIAPR